TRSFLGARLITTSLRPYLLEPVLLENRRLGALDGIQRNLIYPWTAVVEHNAEYRDYVHADALRLGAQVSNDLENTHRQVAVGSREAHGPQTESANTQRQVALGSREAH